MYRHIILTNQIFRGRQTRLPKARNYRFRVIEFDSHNRRIVLSVNAYFAGKEQKDVEEYLAKHPTKVVPVTEIVDAPESTETPSSEKPVEEQPEVSEAPEAENSNPASDAN